eukprot:CAMPEP_0167806766 /NCGR_PEP_ID=MMETSP0111_2-20121227/22063_1 /TAXON_ID=91324 /ORGANISM="Lotharella globosa, Strain CCCM811" /LENGTH=44 /DNA_ID= /DNA_START= /DNA_END= /DNA_ORIENTATION=
MVEELDKGFKAMIENKLQRRQQLGRKMLLNNDAGGADDASITAD